MSTTRGTGEVGKRVRRGRGKEGKGGGVNADAFAAEPWLRCPPPIVGLRFPPVLNKFCDHESGVSWDLIRSLIVWIFVPVFRGSLASQALHRGGNQIRPLRGMTPTIEKCTCMMCYPPTLGLRPRVPPSLRLRILHLATGVRPSARPVC